METILSIALGVSLAASCGLRAFLPLFAAGLLGRLLDDQVSFNEGFRWLASTPCLAALAVAVVAEVAADKIPALDHALDAVQTPVRTIAGVVVCAAVVVDLPTWITAITALVAGGGAALSVHSAKATARVASTATTAGVANPVLSFLEDGLCLAASVLSLLFAALAVVFCLATLAAAAYVLRAVLRRRKRGRAAASAAPLSEAT
ncbi:MAG: DUF4126 domain-containing protein [Planctomycetota bacterium]|nr:MAG: DUF4126 domain-containing protein [Planctomycetota bacterium]